MISKYFTLCLALVCLLTTASAAGTASPNLLIIHTDEHNFRTLGCYRALLPNKEAFVWGEGITVETPHVDSLAKNGAICDRFYTASPVCTPSRASFVTGLYPQNTGAPSNDLPMRDDVVTFGEVLRRAGYSTGYAGKWHLDGEAKPGWTPKRQFGFTDNKYMFNRGHWKKLEDTPQGPRVKGGNSYDVAGADEKSFTTDFLTDKTVEFIRANKGKPFCFMVSIPDPHGPNTVRPPYDTMFDSFKFQLPVSAKGQGRLENMSRYFGMIKCIDDNVGKILKALRDAGVLEKTIVVFTSDHGDMCGEHGRNNKGIPEEGSARIPFVISYPGKIKPGMVVHEALATVDFKPTVLRMMGVADDSRNEGRDASALFLTGKAPADWKNIAFSRMGSWMMAVSSRYKLVVSMGETPRLFDLEQDAFEMHDIFSVPASRPVVRELGRALLDYATRCKDPIADNAAIRADLVWAAGNDEKYVPPQRTDSGRKGKKRGGRNNDESE